MDGMKATSAIFKQHFLGFFRNPTGLVFGSIFVLATACLQFWYQNSFFTRNLANLDPLNEWFPYLLLLLVPAITMGAWAEERKQGTDELLLTLPATDPQVVIGKYLACIAIYAVALLCSLSNVAFLVYCGRPDPGLIVANYLGYFLLGAALISVGMVGSFVSESMPVAFVLGAALNLVLLILPEPLGVVEPFRDFTGGMLTLRAAGYYLAISAAMLYLCLALLGRRRWGGPDRLRPLHAVVRVACALCIAATLHVLLSRVPVRLDLTAERLHTLSDQTLAILDRLRGGRPIYVQAYVSPEVPREYVQTRETLLGLLREFQARSGGTVRTRVYDTIPYTREAREADERFGIRAEKLLSQEEGRIQESQVFLGIGVTSGAEEVVVPFIHRGLPIEYELARSIQVVSRAKRHRVGILQTDAKLTGGFDFERFSQSPEWSIVTELKKQYEVVEVSPEEDYPDDLDVLIAPQPSSLTQPQMDRLVAYAERGKALLVFDDPMPLFDPSLAPKESKGAGRNPFLQQQRAPQPPKGDVSKLYEKLGVRFPVDDIVWSKYNPHPKYRELDNEVVFVAKGCGAQEPFHPRDPVTSGLQEVVFLFGGRLENAGTSGVTFTPLLTVGPPSGTVPYNELLVRSFFGSGLNPNRRRRVVDGEKILAARVSGSAKAIVVADLDAIGEQFFDLRKQGTEELNFDNVTFVLNAVDSLAGDDTFIELRKRRPLHRTLERVEEMRHVHEKKLIEEEESAENEAKGQLAKAQERLNAKVAAVRERKDVDERTREILIQNLEEVENRRFEVEKQNIEDQKKQAIEKSKYAYTLQVRKIHDWIKWLSVGVFPIPLAGLTLLFYLVGVLRARFGRVQEEGR